MIEEMKQLRNIVYNGLVENGKDIKENSIAAKVTDGVVFIVAISHNPTRQWELKLSNENEDAELICEDETISLKRSFDELKSSTRIEDEKILCELFPNRAKV